jgi:outer membrane protein TolC
MKIVSKFIVFFFYAGFSSFATAEELNLSQALQRLIDYYPTLQIAKLKTEQASWEINNVKNRLSWKLNGAAGMVHDVSAFGTPFDRFEASANLDRKLSSGHSVGVSGRYQYNDDSFVINNSLPNPSQSLDFDINYRIPLGQGEDNIGYHQSLLIAETQKNIEELNRKAILKSLTGNIVSLFHEISSLEQRMLYTKASIQRSRRLKQYIVRNKELGLYEDKDVLEANAQLLKVIAERESISLALSEQKNTLRKLLGMDTGSLIDISINRLPSHGMDEDELLSSAKNDDPLLQIKMRTLDIADANIRIALNENSDKKDMVLSLGARTLNGDSATESISEEDYAAQIRFEYEYDLGRHAYTSRIEKIKRQKDIILQEVRLNQDSIKYELTALLDKIKKQHSLINKLKQHQQVSSSKLNDALNRYKQGRIDTTRLIQFENDLHLANLDLSSANTNLSHSEINLSLLTGRLLSQLKIEAEKNKR